MLSNAASERSFLPFIDANPFLVDAQQSIASSRLQHRQASESAMFQLAVPVKKAI
jgi:hypothetical protein